MAVAFNPSEEVREGAHPQHHHHHAQHTTTNNSANAAPPPPEPPSEGSSASSSATSSTNSSPGAVTGPMSIPQAQYAQAYAPMYYYPAGSSPVVPPHSPVPPTATVYRQYNNEELIQAICEALHRCSNGQLPPPSPSCSPFTPANVPLTPYAVYGQTQAANPGETNVFFPQNMPATPHAYYATHPQPPQVHQPPQSPISHPSYFSLPQQQQPLYFQYHNVLPNSPYANATPAPSATSQPSVPPSTVASSSPATPQPQMPRRAARRIRLSSHSEASPSTSHRNPEESSESDMEPVFCIGTDKFAKIIDSSSSSNHVHNNSASSDSDSALHDHLSYLEARERLEEFPGRVPQRRKKSMATASSSSSTAKNGPIGEGAPSSVVITSQKQQQRQANKTNETANKDTSSTPVLARTSIATRQPVNSSSTPESNFKSAKCKEQCLSWSLFTAFVLVVGCGFFASR